MKRTLPVHPAIFLGWIYILIAVFLWTLPAAAQSSSRKLVNKGTNGAPFGYFEYLPTGYSSTSEKKPLIIYLHGAGELGNGTTDLPKMHQRALPKLLKNGKEIGFVVIAPQAPSWWYNHDLVPLITWIKSKYNIDPSRIYLTGISMGGTKVWDFAGDRPDLITAALPLGADARNMDACRLSSLPVWAFHGAKDNVYPASAMTAAIYKLNNQCNPRANPPAKGNVYSNQGHDDLWDYVYNGTYGHNIYSWMLQYRKSTSSTTNKAPVANAGPDITISLPTNSLYIKGSGSDSDGKINSYWWTKISGPTVKMSSITSSSMYAYELVAGTYEFELKVTDDKGATATDRMKLTVNGTSGGTTTSTAGVKYKYYEGNWSMLPNFGSLNPRKTGTVSTFSIAPRSRSDYFGFMFDGYIKISSSGTYTFYTKSDDGSKLYINGKEIVNHDGLHGMSERYGSVYLAAGSHAIKVTYFERTGTGEGLIVSYKGPNITKREIPGSVLSTGSTSSSATLAAAASLSNSEVLGADGEEVATSTEVEALQIEVNKEVRILQNPVIGGRLQLAASTEQELLREVLVYDSSGRAKRFSLLQDGDGWQIDTGELLPGMYILLLQTHQGTTQRLRFIQQ